MSLSESKAMHKHVAERAAEVGLTFSFETAVIANSLRAHQLIQLAKTKGQGDVMEEVFFSAYFCEGEDLNDDTALMRLGIKAGLNPLDISETLAENSFSTAINKDIFEAQQIGVRGVPFFVFDRKYAISGAQPVATFIETIQALV
jgi:protein disulfide-isomerase